VVPNYEIIVVECGHANFLEMLAGQEFSRLIVVTISSKAGEDSAERLVSNGGEFPSAIFDKPNKKN
jgi:hypothetical protein